VGKTRSRSSSCYRMLPIELATSSLFFLFFALGHLSAWTSIQREGIYFPAMQTCNGSSISPGKSRHDMHQKCLTYGDFPSCVTCPMQGDSPPPPHTLYRTYIRAYTHAIISLSRTGSRSQKYEWLRRNERLVMVSVRVCPLASFLLCAYSMFQLSHTLAALFSFMVPPPNQKSDNLALSHIFLNFSICPSISCPSRIEAFQKLA
jgi:hypothetical protein